MNRRFCPAHRAGAGFALLVVALLASHVAQADVTYRIQAIAKQGDTIGPVTIKPNADFEVGTLNDRGQLIFITENTPGGEAMILYTDGQLLPIAYAGGDAPGGTWPMVRGFGVFSFVSMNQLGNIVFAPTGDSGRTTIGTFLWESDTRKVTPIALKDQPAANNLTFVDAGGGGTSAPVINNFGEIAFPGIVKNNAGKNQPGIFFQGRDGKLLPVALPDQELPDGQKIVSAFDPQINDAGSVAFLAQRAGDKTLGAYLWEKGPITPLAAIGTDTPGGKLANVYSIWLNNSTRSVVVLAPLKRGGPGGLYRIANGQVTPLVVPGQEMPGTGKLTGIDWISFPNDADQHAIIARITGGVSAAYLVDPDGKLSLVLKSDTATDLGTVTKLGQAGTTPNSGGIALNNRGQVALPVRITGGPAMILLLTPTTP